MKRRQFLKASIASGVSLSVIGGGAIWLNSAINKDNLTIDLALKQLEDLSNKEITHTGEWEPFQIFTHCAQSIEYSMLGFPEHKSDFFKSTVGQLAFSVFSSQGRMTHSLSEFIPGAPIIPQNTNIALALKRLITAFIAFKEYKGTLAPHFAYGPLSKNEYEIAHVIHLNNHLQEITR